MFLHTKLKIKLWTSVYYISPLDWLAKTNVSGAMFLGLLKVEDVLLSAMSPANLGPYWIGHKCMFG